MSGGPKGLTHQLLREIDETTQDVFDLGTLADAKRREGSRRNSYEKALHEVQQIAGRAAARALADWIQETIQHEQEFPNARDVRQRGAKLCRENGYAISTGSWLGA